AGMTNAVAEVSTVTFSNGASITGTTNHKMIADGKLFTIDSLPLGSKVYTDSLWSILKWRIRHLFDTKARHIGFRQQIEDITQQTFQSETANALNSSSIEQYGKTRMGGKSQKDTSFTIVTTTLS